MPKNNQNQDGASAAGPREWLVWIRKGGREIASTCRLDEAQEGQTWVREVVQESQPAPAPTPEALDAIEAALTVADRKTDIFDAAWAALRRLRSLPPSAPASPTPGAQEEADMEPGKYLVLSIKWTRKADGVLTWWGPSDSGYHCVMDHAGRYTLDQIRRAPSYYNNRETTLAVPAGPANLLAVPSGIWNGRCVPYSKLKEIKAMAVTPDPLEGAGEGRQG